MERTFVVSIAAVAVVLWALQNVGDSPWEDVDDDGGWGVNRVAHLDTSRCTIPRMAAGMITRDDFAQRYLEQQPVILVGATNASDFHSRVGRKTLLESHGSDVITLSSANRDSYSKTTTTLAKYVDSVAQALDDSQTHANETWYFFGDNDRDGWKDLFQHYKVPMRYVFGPHTTLSFGIAASGTGVPFHTHGHVFAEVLYGWKRWWLQDPKFSPPQGEGNATTLSYLRNVYPRLLDEELLHLHECVLGAGEMLYIPSGWFHATLNIGPTVFMSAFV